jgi:hypothetical protein
MPENFFPFLITLAITFNIILDKSGEKEQLCIITDLTEKAFCVM